MMYTNARDRGVSVWQCKGQCVGAALQVAVRHRGEETRGQDSQTTVQGAAEHRYREGSNAGAASNLLVSTASETCASMSCDFLVSLWSSRIDLTRHLFHPQLDVRGSASSSLVTAALVTFVPLTASWQGLWRQGSRPRQPQLFRFELCLGSHAYSHARPTPSPRAWVVTAIRIQKFAQPR